MAACKVLLTTSHDPAHPERNITDGTESTYWLSTGMFPQDIVVEVLDGYGTLVNMSSTGVKAFRVEVCSDPNPVNFSVHDNLQLDNSDGIQNAKFSVPNGIRYFKVCLLSGYSDFPSVHKISMQ